MKVAHRGFHINNAAPNGIKTAAICCKTTSRLSNSSMIPTHYWPVLAESASMMTKTSSFARFIK